MTIEASAKEFLSRSQEDCSPVGQFGHDLGDRKHLRAVHLRRSLSVVGHPRHNELGLDLGDDQGGQDGDDEDGEDSVLQLSRLVAELEESESGDQGDDDMREESGVLVVGVPPQRNVGSVQDSLVVERRSLSAPSFGEEQSLQPRTNLQLEHERGRVFPSEVLGNLLVSSDGLFVQLLDFSENGCSLLGSVPFDTPVLVSNSLSRTL
jgi:hypothetical protein